MNQPAPLHFPVAGITQDRAYSDQSPLPLPVAEWAATGGQSVVPGVGVVPTPDEASVYGRTCADARNVRAYEATLDRRRGGRRPGTSKVLDDPLVAGWVVQHMATTATVDAGSIP